MAGLDELKSDESSLMIYYRCPTPLFVSLNKRGRKLHGALKNLEIPHIMVQTLGACDEWVGGRFCSQMPDTFFLPDSFRTPIFGMRGVRPVGTMTCGWPNKAGM